MLAKLLSVAAAFALLLGASGCGSGTLDDAAAIDAALPTTKDMPGYAAFSGVTTILAPPVTAEKTPGGQVRVYDGRQVFTGRLLQRQCDAFTKDGDDWACDRLQGLGYTGFLKADTATRIIRIGSYVLAYDSEDAAKLAWKGAVADVGSTYPSAERKAAPSACDQSQASELGSGTLVLLRCESVVAVVTTSGFEPGTDLKDPIESFTRKHAERIEAALD